MARIRVLLLVGIALFALSCEKNGGSETRNSKEPRKVFKGSDTELEMIETLQHEFSIKYPEATNFKVEGGGSKTGIEALINNEVVVANSSRKMTLDEYERSFANDVNPTEVIVATDAIAIITNQTISIDSLSLHQLRQIYNGTYTNWNEVGGPDKEIHLYGRNATSGTHDYIKRNVLNGKYSDDVKELTTTQDVIDAVKNDAGGIGYVGIGSLTDKGGKPVGDVWATYMYIEGNRAYSPHEKYAIRIGAYPLSRPLFQYFNGLPKGDLKLFVEFILSDEGQELVEKHGYFPINYFHRQINQDNGIVIL
jgi:phosphate transport system substrate-binding protein